MESRVLIGVALSELKNIKKDTKVEYIFKENESGASRGLLCALDIYNKITEYETFQIDDEKIIKILNKEYSNTQHYYSANSTYEEIIYERVEDQEENIYAKELLTGSLFPIECDGTIETKVYTIKRLVTNGGIADYCDLAISSDSNHVNYARIEKIVVKNMIMH